MGSGQAHSEPLKTLDIRVCLSDHTGTLENCRLSGKFAEQTLGCDVSICTMYKVIQTWVHLCNFMKQ